MKPSGKTLAFRQINTSIAFRASMHRSISATKGCLRFYLLHFPLETIPMLACYACGWSLGETFDRLLQVARIHITRQLRYGIWHTSPLLCLQAGREDANYGRCLLHSLASRMHLSAFALFCWIVFLLLASHLFWQQTYTLIYSSSADRVGRK